MAGETTYANGYTGRAFKGDGPTLCVLDVSHEITTTELQLADKIIFGRVPTGAIYVGGYLATDDLDSGGSPALVLDVGDDDSSNGLLDGTTTGQAAAVTQFNGAYITNRQRTTAEKNVILTVQTAPATAAAGTVRLVLYYYVP